MKIHAAFKGLSDELRLFGGVLGMDEDRIVRYCVQSMQHMVDKCPDSERKERLDETLQEVVMEGLGSKEEAIKKPTIPVTEQGPIEEPL